MARQNSDDTYFLLSGRFLLVTFMGSIASVLMAAIGSVSDQLALAGSLLSAAIGIHLSYVEYAKDRDARLTDLLRELNLSEELAQNPRFMNVYREITRSIGVLAAKPECTLRDLAYSRLLTQNAKIQEMADERLVFENTESWRTVYEDLLRKESTKLYRSVAWFRNEDYWQDEPGKSSLKLNCELVSGPLQIDRTVIVADNLWPIGDVLPAEIVSSWIAEQYAHGIWIRLLCESQLENEPDLLSDFGLYGEEAVGYQTVDESGRTTRFELNFRQDRVRDAQQKWERVNLYAIPYADLLDQLPKRT